MDDIASSLLQWSSAHATWAGIIVFLIAFSESLAIVGLFLPGAAMMFGIGALVGSGGIELLPTLVWAASGAIAGDGVSYWLGRHYHQQIKVMWPFRSHPELVARSTDFFYRHGGKSILFGRFIGPIRPVIPAVAGMLEMAPGRFFLVNIISGILWAPVYIMPGMVFAASLGVAAEVATRLAVFIGLIIGALVLLFWLMRLLFDWLHHRTYTTLYRILEWSRLHPIMGEMPAALLDPKHPESRGLTMLAILLILTALSLAWLINSYSDFGLLGSIDSYIGNTVQGLHSPLGDRVMAIVGHLGTTWVLLPLFTILSVWMIYHRYWNAFGHWFAAGAFTLVLAITFRLLPSGDGTLSPCPHATSSLVIFGFLAVLIAQEIVVHRRWLVYAVAGSLILLINLAWLYLDLNSYSNISAGMLIGLSWVLLLSLAYHRHPSASLRLGSLLQGSLASLVIAVAVTSAYNPLHAQKPSLQPRPISELHVTEWLNEGWRFLPHYRNDMRGRHTQPFTVQYAGSLEQLEKSLLTTGWHKAEPLTSTSWLKWLNQDMPLAERPILPHVHDGRNETLLLIHAKAQELTALRLWPAQYRLQPGMQPVWLATVSRLAIPDHNPIFKVPFTRESLTEPLETFRESISTSDFRAVMRQHVDGLPVWLLEETKDRFSTQDPDA